MIYAWYLKRSLFMCMYAYCVYIFPHYSALDILRALDMTKSCQGT